MVGVMFRTITKNLPSEDNKKVESVPVVRHVSILAANAHGEHLDDHLDGEKAKDDIIKLLQHLTPVCHAVVIDARLVHTQGNTVEQYGHHTNSLEPCVNVPNEIGRVS